MNHRSCPTWSRRIATSLVAFLLFLGTFLGTVLPAGTTHQDGGAFHGEPDWVWALHAFHLMEEKYALALSAFQQAGATTA
jgi:hypothetical protein